MLLDFDSKVDYASLCDMARIIIAIHLEPTSEKFSIGEGSIKRRLFRVKLGQKQATNTLTSWTFQGNYFYGD